MDGSSTGSAVDRCAAPPLTLSEVLMSLQVILLFGVLLLMNVAFFTAWIAWRKTYVGCERPLMIE